MAKRKATRKPGAVVQRQDFGAPTEERQRHGPIEEVRTLGSGTVIRMTQPPIARYLARGSIEKRQHIAAERLVTDYELGMLGARDPEAHSSSGAPSPISEAQLMAIEAYVKAIQAVGKRLLAILIPVVLGEEDVSALARRLGKRIEGVMELLKLGLDTLADHYGV